MNWWHNYCTSSKGSKVSAYKYISSAWRKPAQSYVGELARMSAIEWRREPAITRIVKPTRLDRARRLGYKAKRGYVMVRVRVKKGGARKPRPVSGRRPKAIGVTKFVRAKSLKKIAEERASRKFPNLRVMNSYWVWEDGRNTWFEIVMIDPKYQSA